MSQSLTSKYLLTLEQFPIKGAWHLICSPVFAQWVNTHNRNECYSPLINNYSGMSECLLASKCGIALKRYHAVLCLATVAHYCYIVMVTLVLSTLLRLQTTRYQGSGCCAATLLHKHICRHQYGHYAVTLLHKYTLRCLHI